jgi:anti-sigma regulatory factor (Ser/Thr protein kinase)
MGTLSLIAAIDALPEALEFVRGEAREAGVPEGLMGKLDLIVEELFVNVALYAYLGVAMGTVVVTCTSPEAGRLAVEIADQGREYDPLAQATPQLSDELSERKAGGLGVHIVKQWTQALEYRREAGWNRLCFEIDAARAADVGA